MQEEWVNLEDFDGFAVSNFGRVRNLRRDIVLRSSRNRQGIAIVGLHKNGRHTTRSVALLVAENFIENEDPEIYNSPIQLDGDRLNCHVENILWRPRWFAVGYHRQFWDEKFHYVTTPIEVVQTGEIYYGWKDVCITYGLRYIDIIKSFTNNERVWPTGHKFALL